MAVASPPPARASFSRRLRELRIPRGYKTARKLATALGIDENRYTRYERAEVEPDLTMLLRICETLGITPNDLFGISPPPGSISSEPAKFSEPTSVPASPFGRDSEGASSRAGERDRAEAKRRALGWQLAREVALAEAATPGSGQAEGAISTMLRTSKMFQEIEADPFAFVARTVEAPALTTLDRSRQAKIAALIEDLIEAINRSALG